MLNLKTSVGSRKSKQALGAPGKTEKALITNKVTTRFSVSPCTPIPYVSFPRPTEVFRLKNLLATILLAAFLQAAHATPWPLEIIDHLDETKIVIYVSESDIEASPQWNPAAGAPKFGLDELFKAVNDWQKKNKCTDADGIEKIELKPILHQHKEGRWYYLVQLKDMAKAKPSHRYL
ncbi:MAG TPA: hypothetical protein ENJ35_04810, partial [Gammaproteobacteria bacterium]|nr:hypothetical protein [Gammaproteobacteria bacterium]